MGIAAVALARIKDDIQKKRYNQVALAKASGRTQGTISDIVNGKAGLPYDVIEAAAELRGVDPAELVASETTEVRVLNPLEAEFLRYARGWPPQVLASMLDFLRHFAAAGEAEEQIRNAVTYMRKIKRPERSRALAYLLLISEGQLPSDFRVKGEFTPPGGSIDALLEGLSAKDVEFVRAAVMRALASRRPKTRG